MHIVIDARIRRSSTGRYTDRLVEHLQKIDHNNQYTILVQPDDPWKLVASNFTCVHCPFPQFSFNPINDIRFSMLLRRLKPDLVHFSMTQQPVSYLGTIVTTTMDLTMLRFTRPGKSPLPIFWAKMAGYRFLFWAAHRKSRAIITLTNFVKKDLIAYHPFTKKKISVTPCASEPPIAGEGKSIPGVVEPFILYVGTAFPHKNLERLVEAFEIIHKKHPDLRLVMAGKKEYYYQQLEKLIQSSVVKNHITITGFVTDNQLKWLYEHTIAYVTPSLSEGFGLTGVEAMTYGAPVVSSNATTLPEVHGDAALYFDPENVNDIASAIEKVLKNDKLRQKLVAKGYKQIKKYSWAKMAEQTLEVYQEVLGQK